eukprot:1355-Heterococcus_DN1.PRE.2
MTCTLKCMRYYCFVSMYDISCKQFATGTGASTAIKYMSISNVSTSVHMLNCHVTYTLAAASTTATVTANSSALNSNCLTVCDSGNPNGYYRLNLADPRGRETARQLQELAVSQRGELLLVHALAARGHRSSTRLPKGCRGAKSL